MLTHTGNEGQQTSDERWWRFGGDSGNVPGKGAPAPTEALIRDGTGGKEPTWSRWAAASLLAPQEANEKRVRAD